MNDSFRESNGTRAHAVAFHQPMPFAMSAQAAPNHSLRSERTDSTRQNHAINTGAHSYAASHASERNPVNSRGAAPALATTTSDPQTFGQDNRAHPAILMRRLSRNISSETLTSMLTFSTDVIDTEFIHSPYPEDLGFATAIARFQTQAGAIEAQQKLNGKPNSTRAASMIVEIHKNIMAGSYERRSTIDGIATRAQTGSVSSAGSLSGPPSRPRFGSMIQSPSGMSPPLATSSSGGSLEFPTPETGSHLQDLFSPGSPVENGLHDRQRISGKYTIKNDAMDDETGELLKDALAYAQSGQQQAEQTLGRRRTNPQVPLPQFGSLSLGSNEDSSDDRLGGMCSRSFEQAASPRTTSASHHPMSPKSPSSRIFPQSQFPPVNPADHNPPCNTLYVGNLPLDTSEDELKTIFCKQRGYRRLCFRTKQNGPMCFVEFEDISFATKALSELYGYMLSNSIKGGIRLSFSKNPLGVRSTHQNGAGHSPAMNPHAMAPGYGINPAFSRISGPPPGLGSPPGLNNSTPYNSHLPQNSMDGTGMFSDPFGMMPSPNYDNPFQGRDQRAIHHSAASPHMDGSPYARRNPPAYNDYTLGR